MPKSRTPFHIQFLKQEMLRRSTKNPAYSMRAFAKALSMAPAELSRLLSGKQSISLKSAVATANNLGLDDADLKAFLTSIAEEKIRKTLQFLAESAQADLVIERVSVPASRSREKIL
jgi:plasmid maintenance system antidote protein VapI